MGTKVGCETLQIRNGELQRGRGIGYSNTVFVFIHHAIGRILTIWVQPYPANPSFRPPAPISDALRTKIYQSFMADPQKNNIHELGARHNLSLKRVQAILRLKGLEAHWIKVCHLGCRSQKLAILL
jgi:hypothetical protein